MEAVPRLPMLSFELKISPVCPDFAAPLKRIITKYYGEDGDLYDREIMQLETCRTNACRAPRDFTGCSLLKRYYAQIFSLYNRLVVFESPVGVQCIWADIYTGQTNIGDLDFELACILYNIGALHAELGATDSRQTADEMKVSCTHFQCAAWAFQTLMEEDRLHRSSDMSSDLLSFFVQVTLAQAQECILEKSMLDSRKASIVAKVAAQVVDFYRRAMALLQQGAMNSNADAASIVETVGAKLFKEWKRFVEFKLAYYGALCHLYMGNLAEEQQKMGERVAWYESSEGKLKEAAKLAKGLDSAQVDVSEAVNFVADVITVKLSNAKKENDFIYHEKVPAVESLAEITGAPLVKGIPFSVTDPEIAGQDIFARLVPIEAHETASLYSARKDEILRNIRSEIGKGDEELASYLSALQLSREGLRAPKEAAIPDELIDICAELSLQPRAVSEVEATLARLDAIAEETEKAIEEAKALLAEEEAAEEAHARETFASSNASSHSPRPPSLILVELKKELARHEATHLKAVQSNRSLWENFDQHKDDIKVMTSSSAAKIASILPSVTKAVGGVGDEATVAEMERLFDKVEEMRRQRVTLEERLTREMDADSALKLVLAHPGGKDGDIETVFDRTIREKYDPTVALLRQNLAAQENILRALTECNARYAETRKATIEIGRARKTRIASLMYTFQVFKELVTNSAKGLEFYEKFAGVVTRLGARIAGVCKVQQEERLQFASAAAQKAKFASMNSSFGPSIGPSPVVPPLPSQNAYIPSMPSMAASVSSAGGGGGPLKLKDYLPFMTNQLPRPMVAPSPTSSTSSSSGIAPSSGQQYVNNSYGTHQQPSMPPASNYNYSGGMVGTQGALSTPPPQLPPTPQPPQPQPQSISQSMAQYVPQSSAALPPPTSASYYGMVGAGGGNVPSQSPYQVQPQQHYLPQEPQNVQPRQYVPPSLLNQPQNASSQAQFVPQQQPQNASSQAQYVPQSVQPTYAPPPPAQNIPPQSPYVASPQRAQPTYVASPQGQNIQPQYVASPQTAYVSTPQPAQSTYVAQPQTHNIQPQYVPPQPAQPTYTSQPVTQNIAPSQPATYVLQAMEMESKSGWPVMMPTSADSKNSNNITNGNGIPPSTQAPSQPVPVASSLPEVAVSNGHAIAAVSNGNSSKDEAASDDGQPKDLLSQFDPLFS